MTDITGKEVERKDIILLIEPSIKERKLALGIITRCGVNTAEVIYLPLEDDLDDYQVSQILRLLGRQYPDPILYSCSVKPGQIVKLSGEEMEGIKRKIKKDN